LTVDEDGRTERRAGIVEQAIKYDGERVELPARQDVEGVATDGLRVFGCRVVDRSLA